MKDQLAFDVIWQAFSFEHCTVEPCNIPCLHETCPLIQWSLRLAKFSAFCGGEN